MCMWRWGRKRGRVRRTGGRSSWRTTTRSRCSASWNDFRRTPRGPARDLLPVLLTLLLTACATGGGLRPRSDDSTPPWEIPADAYGTQRLYRAHYTGPEGDGSFHVTLRLASPVRYQIVAGDPVGRSLWALDVTAEREIGRASCRERV